MSSVAKIASVAAGAALMCSFASNVQASGEMDEKMLLELKKLIEQQQKQLDQQAQQISQLTDQLGGATEEIEKKADKEDLEKLDTGKMVTSRFEDVDVNIYGHLNKGVLWSDNGKTSKATFVDNSNSQSRIGLNASVSPSEKFTAGGRVEYGMSSNSSSDVSGEQTYNATSLNWNLRWGEIFFTASDLGKVSLGRGSTASDGTAEVDMSGTDVVTYASVADLNGGQYFYAGNIDTLTEVRVKDVFNDMDGLGRADRLRYDSPSFAGFTFSTSAVSGDAYDAAITYSREFSGTKVAGAIAWSSPGDTDETISNQYNGSLSVLLANGLNGTFSAGSRDMKADIRDDATVWYGKLGYRFDACSLGKTSVSVDYGENKDILTNNDTAKTWSLAAVQDIPSWGTEFYLAYRNYRLDTDIGSIDDVNAVLGGARVKF